ncbi:MAG: GntR family transcriptional regulator [Deltaproteobacteria bacterium]|nr:GntR family transcriptional regulator [Deltaproteobacteria bacterium]
MRHLLHVDPADAVPIWRQIEEGVRNLVASRTLKPGTIVPSVRELARELRINPATVSKAYQRLCEAGVLEVRRGQGTFVAEAAPILDEGEREQRLREGAARYASLARTLDAGRTEAIEALRGAFDELEQDRKGEGDE